MASRRSFFVCLLFLGILQPGECTTPGEMSPVISLDRSTCYGTCPSYSLEIFSDGTVKYVGRRFVRVKGKRTTKISVAEVRRLVDAFAAISYEKLKEDYVYEKFPDGTTHITVDVQEVTTTLNLDGQRKSVRNHYRGSEELSKLENEIDRTVGSAVWVKKRSR